MVTNMNETVTSDIDTELSGYSLALSLLVASARKGDEFTQSRRS